MALLLNQIAATASLLLGWTNGLAEWILWSICTCGALPFFCVIGILQGGFGPDAFASAPTYFICRIVTCSPCWALANLVVRHVAFGSFENVLRPETNPSKVLARQEPLDFPARLWSREIEVCR